MKASDQSESNRTTNTTTLPVCPACASASVTTTAKNPDIDSYWRCQQCGEVWNVSRSRAARGRNFRWR